MSLIDAPDSATARAGGGPFLRSPDFAKDQSSSAATDLTGILFLFIISS